MTIYLLEFSCILAHPISCIYKELQKTVKLCKQQLTLCIHVSVHGAANTMGNIFALS